MKNSIAIAQGIGLGGGISTGVVDGATTFITPLSIKGGVVRVIDSATGDMARTTAGFIEDEKYKTTLIIGAGSVSAEFDSAVTRTGRLTVKLSNTDTSGTSRIILTGSNYSVVSIPLSVFYRNTIPVKPSTSYRFNLYCKTNNVPSNGAFADVTEYKVDGTYATQQSLTNKLTGTQDWTLLTKAFTTTADTVAVVITGVENVAGNISDAWFDVNSMTLEEVTSITNAGATSALYYPALTAESSTDNIDQSQGGAGTATGVLGNNTNKIVAQKITPTKKNFTSYSFKKSASVGSPTFDVAFTIQGDSEGKPDGVDLTTPVTITAAQWDAITDGEMGTVLINYTMTVGNSYWIVYTPSAQGDASNYRRLYYISSTGPKLSIFNTSWTNDAVNAYVHTCTYSKNTTNLTVSTDTQTVSVTAPTVDGWADGTIVGFDSPLTLAPDANAIYVGSNGANTADGEVDPSLQATLAGTYVI